MPWCPVCKNEYKEGVTVCADCGAALVDFVGERKEVFLCSGEEALIRRMQKFLEYNDIPVVFETKDEQACLYVLPKHERKAKQAVHVFLVESAVEAEKQAQEDAESAVLLTELTDFGAEITTEAEESEKAKNVFGEPDDVRISADSDNPAEGETEENDLHADGARKGNDAGRGKERLDPSWNDDEGKEDSRTQGGVYRKKSERADDLKSSGEVLLVFGILGCIALLLIDFGILPIRFGNRIMMNVIMFALFFFFIGFGIYSLKGARRFRAEASDEDALTERIEAWVKANLTAEEIDGAAGLDESDGEEICFFKRTEAIRKKIAGEFDGVDESYLDSLTENVYQELFE